jgi:glutathionylspermidine synthase
MAENAYSSFANELVATGLIADPWVDGEPRFEREPVILSSGQAKALADAAKSIAAVYDEAVQVVAEDPELLDDFFGLTQVQKVMFEVSRPLWHGLARADVFFTDEGLQIAELNCDTPTGEAEATVLSQLAKPSEPAGLLDPNAGLQQAFIEMLERLRESVVGSSGPRTVGIIYPTEFTEDLSLIKLYRRWLEQAGYEVALGSPYNLRSTEEDATVRVFSEPVSVLLRHYKTDWWSERASAWRDEELLDTAPLERPLKVALRAQVERKTVTINPFGAVVPQNKRTMALMWEHIHRFSVASQEVIRRLVPMTSRLETLHPALLTAKREEWVIKSDYGAEGDEVVIGKTTPPDEWERCLSLAQSGRWIAQRHFDAELDAEGRSTNFGVFIVAGEPRGLYVRKQVGATDGSALSVPVFIDPARS